MDSSKPIYRRVLLKLSGEALQGDHSSVDTHKLTQFCSEIAAVRKLGIEIALVIGGGNIIRGSGSIGLDRVTADQMGMLATIINGLALRDAFDQQSIPAKIFSALAVPGLVHFFDRKQAQSSLSAGEVVIFVGGTGNPLVTTDSAAALRGIEIGADIVLKATKVEGVFTEDPLKNPQAKRFSSLTYDEVIAQRLAVMDLNAILLCKDHQLPLRVFNIHKTNALQKILLGEDIGTQISKGE